MMVIGGVTARYWSRTSTLKKKVDTVRSGFMGLKLLGRFGVLIVTVSIKVWTF